MILKHPEHFRIYRIYKSWIKETYKEICDKENRIEIHIIFLMDFLVINIYNDNVRNCTCRIKLEAVIFRSKNVKT